MNSVSSISIDWRILDAWQKSVPAMQRSKLIQTMIIDFLKDQQDMIPEDITIASNHKEKN